jgi:CRP/FNR family transcriptional regulator
MITSSLGREWIQMIESNRLIREYDKGETIFAEGDVANEIAFINNGKTKIAIGFGAERTHILRLAKDGDIVGIRAVGRERTFPASIIALTKSELSFMPYDLFDEILHKSNSFCYQFMMLLGTQLRESEKHMRVLHASKCWNVLHWPY